MLILVGDDVINDTKLGVGEDIVEWVLEEVLLETWEEDTLVLLAINSSLDKTVDGVTVGSDAGDDDCTVLVGQGLGLSDGCGSLLDGVLEGG